ncbi:tudor domain-containing protein 1-like isoform X2 [Acropora muricata]|uniref:tudor domain-containing protein 1-like isoform X2 n=1 Tax=Acropora muricata TaxID=159855 RepID=UPI0034E60C87
MQRTPTCKNCCKSYGFKDVSKPIGNRIPLLLECGHTYCEGCIAKWARVQKSQVLCPECTHSTPLTLEGEKGVGNIPANIYLLGVITNAKRASFRSDIEKTGRSKLGSKVGLQRAISQFTEEKKAKSMKAETGGEKCEECSRATATCSCNKCETLFCSGCFERVHSYSNALRKHIPMPVVQTSNIAVGCPEHNNRPLEFYDTDDGQPVCSHCVVTRERQTHLIVPIDDIANNIQTQFRVSLEEVSSTVSHLEKSVQKICGAIPEVKAEKNNTMNDIREHFHLLFAILQARQQSLIKDVELEHNSEMDLEKLREEATQNLQKAKDFIRELENLISQPQKLIDNAKKLKSQLETFQEMESCAVAVKSEWQKVKFDAGEEDLYDKILKYGSVSTNGLTRLRMKKFADMNEEELKHFSEDVDYAEIDQREEQQEEVENKDPNTECVQRKEASPVRSITASKILRASLAYRHELVLVTHIRDPCQFMIQRVADMEQLQLMMNVINIYCDSTEKVHDLLFEVKFGDMVCAQFTTDNQWYRACVKTAYSPASPNTVPTLENGLCVEVQYIDYGNSEWLPLSRLRKMKKEFLKIPELAQSCSLADIVPPFQEEKWPTKAIRAFGSLTGDKALLMTVIEKRGSKMIIDLRRPDDDEPTQDDDRPASVRDALVFLEVARFSSPASKPEGLLFPKKTYKDPVPIGEGDFVDVLVTHVVSPDEIYVQKLQGEEMLELQQIMEEMGKLFKGRRHGSEWSVPWPYKGLLCAARFTEDKIWYRALVTGVNSDDTVNVVYVDFGNCETLPFSDIRKLPDMYLRLPRQALPLSLVDIKPNGDSTEWQQEDQHNISSLLLNRSMVVDVKGVSDDKMSVLLYDTSGAKDVCINAFLVMNGYCQSAGLGLVKSREELIAENENAEETQEKEQVETENQVNNNTENETQSVEASECSSLTEEDQVVTEEKVALDVENVSECQSVSRDAMEEFQYKPASIPATRRFPVGVTYVDSQGYIYAQEVKEGDRTLINIMGALLERYGKGEDQSTVPSDVASITPGFPCCAQFSEDGMWYRAKVIKIVDQEKVEVNYVDFGNSEVLPLTAVRQEIPFIDVPCQCLQFVLRDVEPTTSDGHWPADTIGVLSQLIVGHDCIAAIKGGTQPGYPLLTKLFLPDGSDVTHALLNQGLVQKTNLTDGDKDKSHSYPKKRRGAGKAKTKRSVTETRAHAQMISSREADYMLTHTDLPNDGIRFDVTITHIERPDCLYIQRVPPTDTDEGLSNEHDPTLEKAAWELRSLEQLMAKINEPDFFKKYTPLTTATAGMLCCARYSEDDTWYRAQVKSVEQEEPLQVRVVYVDYGTTEVVGTERLRGFPSELLELPLQSSRCFLADIKPPKFTEEPMMDNGCWPLNTMEALIQLVAGKKLVAKTVFSGPPISVILYEHSTRSDGSVDEVSIGYLLAKRGLAKFLDYEKAHIERLNKLDEDACESEDLGLRRNECGPGTTSDISETYSLSETSTNSNLIDKILAVEMSSAPSPTSEQKPLVSLVLSNGSNDQSSILSSTVHIPISTISSTKGVENAEVSHDQGQATASSGHLTSSTSAVAESVITEVNQYSIESSV